MSASDNLQTQSLGRSLDVLEERLRGQLADLVKANRLFMIIGILLALVMGIYLHFITGELNKYVMDPGTMASFVRLNAQQRMPQVIEELERSLTANAPAMVQEARVKFIGELPRLRTEMEKRLVDMLAKEIMVALQGHLDKAVDGMIRDDKAKLEPLIISASSEEGLSNLTLEFEKLFQKGAGEMLRAKLDEDYNKELAKMVEYMRRLRTAKDLTPMEEYESRIVRDAVGAVANIVTETAKDPLGLKKKAEGEATR